MENNEKRLGKFVISQQLWEKEYFACVAPIFLKIKPIKLESDWKNGYLEDRLILGESPLFDKLEPGEAVPFYAISVDKNTNVTVKRYDITRYNT